MPRVRLWVPWQGPDGGMVPPGEELELDAAEAAQLCEAGGAELVRVEMVAEVAAIAPTETAVRVPRERRPRRKGRT